jgi:hypothetical protein
MEEEIIIEIDPETGKMNIKTEGIKGELCVEEINKLIDEIAMSTDWNFTDEYYQEPHVRQSSSKKEKQNIGGKNR